MHDKWHLPDKGSVPGQVPLDELERHIEERSVSEKHRKTVIASARQRQNEQVFTHMLVPPS